MTEEPSPRTPSAKRVALFAAGAMIALFGIAMLVAWLAGAKAGTTPDWLAAFATLGAFGAALVAGWYAHRALTIEQMRDRDRQEQTDRAQAELVAAWVESGPMYGASHAGNAIGGLQVTGVGVIVRNASQLPVTDVDVAVYHYVDQRPHLEFIATVGYQLLPPDDRAVKYFQDQEIAPLVPPPDIERGPRVAVTFTDTGGRRWMRGVDATLRRVPD